MDQQRGSDDPPQYVAERIREALAREPRVGELDVHVRIAGDKVFLSGFVGTEERRAAITEVVRELMPDHRIFNETDVHKPTEGADLERLG
jgi:osmotically-inducible protein OsmY